MSQFDPLIIFSLIFSLLITLYFYYLYQIDSAIPYFIETKKFRNKKLSGLNNFKSVINSSCYYYSIDFKYLNLVSRI
uniref:ATP synthase F0 subunit 8 n=1 Tax=Pleurosigma intermedium TaxID=197753 RepID=A0A8F9R401_9STRA|nr:ATP synthase F0 subunit 8 [Pleurosigma sp. mgcode 4]